MATTEDYLDSLLRQVSGELPENKKIEPAPSVVPGDAEPLMPSAPETIADGKATLEAAKEAMAAGVPASEPAMGGAAAGVPASELAMGIMADGSIPAMPLAEAPVSDIPADSMGSMDSISMEEKLAAMLDSLDDGGNTSRSLISNGDEDFPVPSVENMTATMAGAMGQGLAGVPSMDQMAGSEMVSGSLDNGITHDILSAGVDSQASADGDFPTAGNTVMPEAFFAEPMPDDGSDDELPDLDGDDNEFPELDKLFAQAESQENALSEGEAQGLDGLTVPGAGDLVTPGGDLVSDAGDIMPAGEEPVSDISDIMPAGEDLVIPLDDMVLPSSEDLVPPADDLVSSIGDTESSVDDMILPSVEDLVPAADDLVPPADDLVPSVDDLVPSLDDLVPSAEDLVPEGDLSSQADTAPSEELSPEELASLIAELDSIDNSDIGSENTDSENTPLVGEFANLESSTVGELIDDDLSDAELPEVDYAKEGIPEGESIESTSDGISEISADLSDIVPDSEGSTAEIAENEISADDILSQLDNIDADLGENDLDTADIEKLLAETGSNSDGENAEDDLITASELNDLSTESTNSEDGLLDDLLSDLGSMDLEGNLESPDIESASIPEPEVISDTVDDNSINDTVDENSINMEETVMDDAVTEPTPAAPELSGDPNAKMSPEDIEALLASMSDGDGSPTEPAPSQPAEDAAVADAGAAANDDLLSDLGDLADFSILGGDPLDSMAASGADAVDIAVPSDDHISAADDLSADLAQLESELGGAEPASSAPEAPAAGLDDDFDDLSEITELLNNADDTAPVPEAPKAPAQAMDLDSIDLDDPFPEGDGLYDIPDKKPGKKKKEKKPKKQKAAGDKKPGFFAKLMEFLADDNDESEYYTPEEIQAKGIKPKEILSDEEKERIKKDKAEAKEKAKKEKADAKAAAKKEKDAAKAAKNKEKKEKAAAKKAEKEAAKKAKPPEPPLRPLGKKRILVSIAFGISLYGVIFIFTSILPDLLQKRAAVDAFTGGEYEKAYNLLITKKLGEQEQRVLDASSMYLKLKRSLDSYENLKQIPGRDLEQLDSLIAGVSDYIGMESQMVSTGVSSSMNNLYYEILGKLSTDYDITEEKARELATNGNRVLYTKALRKILGMQVDFYDINGPIEASASEGNDKKPDESVRHINIEETPVIEGADAGNNEDISLENAITVLEAPENTEDTMSDDELLKLLEDAENNQDADRENRKADQTE